EKARKTVRESRSLLLATSFATGIVLWFFASPSLAIVLFFFSLGLYPSLGFHSDFSTVFSRVKYRAALVAGVIVLFVVLGFIAKTDLGIGVLAYRLGETFAIDSCDQRLEQTGVTSALTGEQSPGCRYWFNKYSFLVFFPFLALALIPYKVFTEKGRRADFLLLAWVLVTMYFAYRQLKATYYFGLPVAASTAYVLAHFRSRLSGVYSANFFAFTTLLVLLGGIGAGMFFITTNSPSIHPGDDLDKVISWLRGNTPQESTKIVNWWGIGHIVSMLSERAVLSDNRQSLLHYAGDIYLAQSEEEAVQKMRELKATHVLVSYGDLAGIESIAQYTYQRLDDPRVQNYSALFVTCSPAGSDGVNCGGADFSRIDYLSLKTWSDVPFDFVAGAYPRFFYSIPSDGILLVAGPVVSDDGRGGAVVGRPESGVPTNNTLLLRLLIEDESLRHFNLVFKSGEYKLYEFLEEPKPLPEPVTEPVPEPLTEPPAEPGSEAGGDANT
ncbi:MAG TPA: hypothetical protein VJA40_02540, partial [archaeon]|nr:hypothetical protein [archaeon]